MAPPSRVGLITHLSPSLSSHIHHINSHSVCFCSSLARLSQFLGGFKNSKKPNCGATHGPGQSFFGEGCLGRGAGSRFPRTGRGFGGHFLRRIGMLDLGAGRAACVWAWFSGGGVSPVCGRFWGKQVMGRGWGQTTRSAGSYRFFPGQGKG